LEKAEEYVAQRTVVLLEDDIDGGEAAETITFAIDGTTYEIDLNENNAAHMRDVLAPFVGAARRPGRAASSARTARPGSRSTSGSSQAPADVDAKAVRAWAEANGVKVSARGRLGAAVLEQYRAAVAS